MQVLVFISMLVLVFIFVILFDKKPDLLMFIIGFSGLIVFIYGLWLLSAEIIKAF